MNPSDMMQLNALKAILSKVKSKANIWILLAQLTESELVEVAEKVDSK